MTTEPNDATLSDPDLDGIPLMETRRMMHRLRAAERDLAQAQSDLATIRARLNLINNLLHLW